jgi:signal transduction histidine kinase
MQATIPITQFAPAERIPIAVARRQAESIAATPLTTALLNSMLNYVFIVNEQRQIIFASRNCRDLLPGRTEADLTGLRPGEALGCVHSGRQAAGCGTTAFCAECGMAKAALASLAGRRDVQECRLTRVVQCSEQALDLLVCATPFQIGGENFAVLSVADISHQKRRDALERVFFHDVLNIAGGLTGLADLLNESVPSALHQDMELLRDGLSEMLDHVEAQKQLAAAESEDLPVDAQRLNPSAVLQSVAQFYRRHIVARERCIEMAPEPVTSEVCCDPALLRRVLGNLLKNALEATPPGQTITAGCEDFGACVRLWIHNPAVMPKSVQLQVFNRSFSTKGLGRGLGTYSVRLLTERYLRGQVDFTSEVGHGTRFNVVLPKSCP